MQLAYRDERLFVARFVIDLNRELYRGLVGTGDGFARRLDMLMVACAVTIGHAEGRPMTATKVAAYLGLPRMTATRRLGELTKAGAIECRARRYYVSPARIRSADRTTHRRVIKLLRGLRSASAIDGLF